MATVKQEDALKLPDQSTPEGERYKAFMKALGEELKGMTHEQQKSAAAMNRDFIRGLTDENYRARASYQRELQRNVNAIEKAVTPGAVHVDTVLATMSVMYVNDDMIGERLMPVVSVTERAGIYYTYNKRDRLAVPDDRIGVRAKSNEIEENRGTDNFSVTDRGLSNFLDEETLQNQDRPLDEMVDLVEALNDMMALAREIRIQAIMSNAASYGTNTSAVVNEWSDANGGDVLANLKAPSSALWRGQGRVRTIGFCGLDVWNSGLSTNPALRELFKYTREGFITEAVLQWFGIDQLLIGKAWMDSANIGQSPSYARVLAADVFGVVNVTERPTKRSAHFGSTFRMAGDPYTTQWRDPAIGKKGGIYARVAVSEDHKIVAPDAGYLLTDCLT